MSFADAFIDKYNLIVGGVVAILSYVLGKHWILFAAFLVLNLVDFFTGWLKSYITKKESSSKGLLGILKKFAYWIIVGVSFGMCAIFIDIGNVLGIDLGVTSLLGWFVLAMLIINEIRSILENLVEAGVNVPTVLIKGLEVASKLVDAGVGVPGETDQNEVTKK